MKNVSPKTFIVAHILLFITVLALFGCGEAQKDSAPADTAGTTRAIQNKGSDTLVNLALAWAERYRQIDPSVSIAVTGGGSGTGIASLINGTVDIANASRQMKENEVNAALKNGVNPVEFTVAIDALAVVVHPANPVDKLTIDQLADIYTARTTNWQDVGGNNAPIILLSRETNSGTHVYFLEEVVRKGDPENEDVFASQTLLMPSSVGITSEIQRNVNAIGYDGLGYVTEHEKMIAIAQDSNSPYVLPSVETGANGTYPIARDLYMYTVGTPSDIIAEYLDWVMGPEGQQIVTDLGFVPLPKEQE